MKQYRVDKIYVWTDDFGNEKEEIHRSTTFKTLEEAEEYFGGGNSVWKMRLYEVDSILLREQEPVEKKPTPEEEQKFLDFLEETLGGKPQNCS